MNVEERKLEVLRAIVEDFITTNEPDQPLWTSWVTFTPTATLGVS